MPGNMALADATQGQTSKDILVLHQAVVRSPPGSFTWLNLGIVREGIGNSQTFDGKESWGTAKSAAGIVTLFALPIPEWSN